jgi:2-methylisocitrate lyase-like PEP mutase family enzyme
LTTQLEKSQAFTALHHRTGAFIMPNPWDIGSARLLQGLGFEALATTSVGFANTMGVLDGQVSREQVLEHCRALCAATDVPVSADLENCFANDPEGAAETIRLAAQTGLAGGSIEDFTGDPAKPIYEFNLAVERVHAAAEAARSLDVKFTLTGRAENLLRGVQDLDDTIRRLQAYEAAGADVLYAPLLTSLDQVRLVTGAVGKPVNVLASTLPGVSLAELADAGANRISIGGTLARAALTALLNAGKEMREQGTFGWNANLASGNEVSALLTK